MATKPTQSPVKRVAGRLVALAATGAVLLLVGLSACSKPANNQAGATAMRADTMPATLATDTVRCNRGNGPNVVDTVLLIANKDTTRLIVTDSICGVVWDGAVNLPIPTKKTQGARLPGLTGSTPVCTWIGNEWVCTTAVKGSADSTAKSGH